MLKTFISDSLQFIPNFGLSLHFIPSLQSAVRILYLICTLYSVCSLQSVSIKCRLQTADCRLQIGYKMQTRYKMQTADCRLGIKCRLRPKLGINCRLRAKLSFRAVGDIFSSLTHPCRVIAFPSSFPRNFLSICTDCEQSMSTDRLFFLR